MVYKDNEWTLQNRKTIIDRMYDDNECEIDSWYNEHKRISGSCGQVQEISKEQRRTRYCGTSEGIDHVRLLQQPKHGQRESNT